MPHRQIRCNEMTADEIKKMLAWSVHGVSSVCAQAGIRRHFWETHVMQKLLSGKRPNKVWGDLAKDI